MCTSRLRLLATALLFGAAVVTVPAQQQVIITGAPAGDVQIPGMPGARPLKTGTGRITGRILSAETGAPIRRAQVRISGPEIGSKAALSDAEGRYEFRDLPAGRFSLSASKSGYVGVQYGQSRPFESGRPIELADKQVLDKADISMPRGSVISGRIVDEFGEPVADAMVSAMRQSWAGGRRRLVPAGRTGQTNDLGQFRMYGLPPGDYYVSATLRNAETMMFDIMGPQGGPTGSNPGSGYAPTYFPGTTTPSEAQKITVAIGQEAHQTDFALMPVRLAKISGVVMSSDGKPLENAMINVVPSNRSGDNSVGMMMMGSSARTSKDGIFTVNGVAPGDYTLNARMIRLTTPDGGGMTFTATIGGPGGDDAEFAAMPITVLGEDLSNVVVLTSKGATATGRLSFEGGSKPATVAGIRIMAVPADPSEGPMMVVGGGQTKADGSFELKGLSGQRLFRLGNLPQGWMMKAVRANGDEVTDTGVEFKSGEVASLEIVATARTTEIQGGVTEANGTPAREYTVVVFSDDPQHWTQPMSRWISGARPDQDGRFKIRNMPAGSYYAAALDYLEAGAWSDPDLLERLRISAKRFTLAEGETETLDLKLTQ
jgi:protocatechuate 3,4-dioxygenase beta subunit